MSIPFESVLKNKFIDEQFVVKISKEATYIDEDARKRCKILSITFDVDDPLIRISKLSENEFPNLFIFILEIDRSTLYQEVQKFLLSFSLSRPLILQLTANDDRHARFFYKVEKLDFFSEISGKNSDCFLTSFLSIINGEKQVLDDETIKLIFKTKDSSITIRLLNIIKLLDEENSDLFRRKIIFKSAAIGSLEDFLASFNCSFKDNKIITNIEMQKFLARTFLENFEENKSDDYESDDITKTSILLTVIHNSNIDVFNFLMNNCTVFTRQLPYDHRLKISSTTFDNNQLDIFCDLIKYFDFPFPEKFYDVKVSHSRLKNIIKDIENFHDAIEVGNMENIMQFIDNNLNLRIACNIDNESALTRALEMDKYEVFYYLMSFGYQATEFSNYKDYVSKRRLTTMKKFATAQIKDNSANALANEEKSVQILSAKSVIHNKKISEQTHAEYRNKIKRWYRHIYNTKYGSKLFNAASQCEKLRIIFDFESKTVGSSDLEAQGSLGTTYTAYKWIFIGAGSSDIPNRDQEIKGVIAHEICHYVLKMIFENNENPFYAGDKETKKYFDGIVILCNQLNEDEIEDEMEDEPELKRQKVNFVDDVIISVYNCYNKIDHHAELIVRVPHIFAQYHNDEVRIAYFETKFEQLFEFYKNFVVPELENFNLQKREVVKSFNKNTKILENIKQLKYEFLSLKYLHYLSEKKFMIITTNTPKLLLLNIFAHLFNNIRCLLESSNIFVSSEMLKNPTNLNDFKEALDDDPNLKVFMLCTENINSECQELIKNYLPNFVLIFHQKIFSVHENIILNLNNLNSTKIIENYEFIDLSYESRMNLLHTKINFQRKSIALVDVVSNKNELIEQDEEFTNGFNDLISEEFFNMLIDKTDIVLNKKPSSKNDKFFDFLFRPRNFLKVENSTININDDQKSSGKLIKDSAQITKLMYEELQEDIKGKCFLLISDIAGNGKSWTLKNLEKKLLENNPDRWITYTDLKQHTNTFKRKHPLKFEEFIQKIVLKLKDDIEIKLFNHLYKIGKVTVLVDGFDEIAPDYASYVLNLIKTFESNEGNQMWLTTRDYFEIDLCEKLQLNTVYKLDYFTKEESANMIAVSWILHDLEEENENLKELDEDAIEKSPNLMKYQKIADDFITKLLHKERSSIGFPLFYKMIADVFKDKKDAVFQITILNVYKECIEIQYARWCFEKGELGQKANIKSLNKTLNFLGIHQFFALKSIFPVYSSFCGLEFEIKEWSNEEIINCGLLYELDGLFFFTHETYREYFAADFIIKVLLKSEKLIDENFCNIFLQFLTERRFGVIRMFLNEALEMSTVSSNIDQKLPIIAKLIFKNVNKFLNLSEIFDSKLDNLSILVISIIKHGSFEEIQIIFKNNQIIPSILKNTGFFMEFQEFILNNLNIEKIKEFLDNQTIFLKVAASQLDALLIEYFFKNIADKINAREFSDIIQSTDEDGNTILFSLLQTNHEFPEKLDAVFEIIQKFLLPFEIIDLINKTNKNGENILFKCVNLGNSKKLEYFWKKINFISFRLETDKLFMDLFNQISLNSRSCLYMAAFCKSIDFHKILFDLLLKEVQNKKDLEEVLLQEYNGSNILHLLTENTTEIVEFMLQFLKNNFDESFYHEILRSKGSYGRSLVLSTARDCNESKVMQIIFNSVRNSCKPNEEFLSIIMDCDDDDSNILYLAACNTNKNVFEFLIKELDTIATIDQIKILFTAKGCMQRNLLQAAAFQNKCLEIHELIWNSIRKYFKSFEILEIAKNFDIYDYNLLLNAIAKNTKEIIKLTWNEIKIDLTATSFENEEISHNIMLCETIVNSISNIDNLTKQQNDLLHFNWIQSEDSDGKNKLISKQNFVIKNFEDLMNFVSDENLENHEKLWKSLIDTFKNCEELNVPLSWNDSCCNNYTRIVLRRCKLETIQFTFKKLKENLCKKHYHEIFTSIDCKGRNLIQYAVTVFNDIKYYQFLWQTVIDSCQSINEFKEILFKTDNHRNNLIFITIIDSSKEFLEFFNVELTKILSKSEIKKIFAMLSQCKKNILQEVAMNCQSLEYHELLWTIIHSHFNSSEIIEFIQNLNIFGDNLLVIVIEKNTKTIIEFTWREVAKVLKSSGLLKEKMYANFEYCETIIKNYLTSLNISVEENEFLRLKWIQNDYPKLFEENSQIILHHNLNVKTLANLMFFITEYSIENHEKMWENLLKVNESCEEKKQLLLQKDSDGNNYISLLIIHNVPDIVEFTIKKLKENLCEAPFQEVLAFKANNGRNLLQIAVVASNNVKMVQILWENVLESCQSVEKFRKSLEHKDSGSRNVFNLAVTFNSDNVFRFLINESEKIIPHVEVKNILSMFGELNRNLVQSAVRQNKSSELHEVFWCVVRKYFTSFEILRLIRHFDIFGDNILSIVIEHNENEVIEMTWNEVKNIIKIFKNEYQNFDDNIEQCDLVIRKVLKLDALDDEEKSILKLNWIDMVKIESLKGIKSNNIHQNFNVKTIGDLMFFMSDKNIENHTKLWVKLLNVYKTSAKLKQILLKKSSKDNNFIHLLLTYNNANIVEFTFNKIKKNLSGTHYKEILNSNGFNGQNLLHVTINSKEVKAVEIVWNELLNSFESIEIFKEFLVKTDKKGLNIFNLTASYGTYEILKFLMKKFEEIFTFDGIKKMLANLNSVNGNLLQIAAYNNTSLQLHKTLWDIVKKYFDSLELLEFVKHSDMYKFNILVNVTEKNTNEVIKYTWKEVENVMNALGVLNEEQTKQIKKCDKIIDKFTDKYFDFENDEFDTLSLKWISNFRPADLFIDNTHRIIKKGLLIKTIKDLKPFMSNEDIQNHEMLWKYLEKKFKPYADLRKLLMEKNGEGDSFIHLIVAYNTKEVIEFTIQNFKKHLIFTHYSEIILSKGFEDRNLLQTAISSSKEIEIQKFLWYTILSICDSNKEFLKILEEKDVDKQNIFNMVAEYSTEEIILFVEEELRKIASFDAIKQLLINTKKQKENVLQTAAALNTSLDANKAIWKIIQRYFETNQIFEFIKHFDLHDFNLILAALENKSDQVLEFTWEQIKETIEKCGISKEEVSKNIIQCDKIIKKTLKHAEPTDEEVELLKMEWLINENSNSPKLFSTSVELVLKNKLIIRSLNELKQFMSDHNLKNHEILWKSLLKIHNNCEDLVALLSQKDEDNNCYLHFIVEFNKSNIIEFTLEQLKQKLCQKHFRKVIKLRGQYGENLLMIAAHASKELRTFNILLKLLKDSNISDNEFLKIFEEFDDDDCNLLDIAACCSTKEIFEYLHDEIAKITSHDQMKKILSNIAYDKQNLLQSAASQNRYLDLQKLVWEIIEKYFKPCEMIEFIENFNEDGFHLLHFAVHKNSIDIIKFLWSKIIVLKPSRENQIIYLEKILNNGNNIIELSEKNVNDTTVASWVKDMINQYKIVFTK